ncbi:nitroreductase family protein [Chengkuizengella axinellae]|uniref:Nitroreductase family protein n=1 Tax=Chengkuizengella axinellae TaxID=3064388 RepID=A0ABT9J0A8_9BACL|nr:nitroreductase family protein [Chengkuizengella sp. 2205SS18-9]MDP5275061.1 nitroreductase family protein [Chengkuizengella sp. 2205SS18-9]
MLSTKQDIYEIINDRKSVRVYDSSVKIDRSEMNEILEETAKAPSSWNLQHWKFLVIDDEQLKQTLLPIAFNQQQVVDAAATIVVLGDLEANKNGEAVYGEAVKHGFMTQEAKDTLMGQINGAYQNQQAAFSEAVLNPSLAAMQLMLVAKAKGYDTCPMGGFDREKIVSEFNIPARYIPVMLLTIGKQAKPAHETPRFPVSQIASYNTFEG